MISFSPTEDETAFVDVAEGFAKDVIRPKARECEQNRAVDDAIISKAEEIGVASLEFPESWDGLELPLISQVQMLQTLSYGDLDIVQGLPGAGDAASIIRLASQNPALGTYKEAGRGGSWPNVAFIDAFDPEEPWAEQLQISRNGDGYTLNGVSRPVRLGAGAEYVAVAAVDTDDEPVVLWLHNVPGSEHWMAVEGDYRLGLLSTGLARLQFNHAEVHANEVLAKGDEARTLIDGAQTRIRILQAAKAVGLMEAALEYATEYTAERKAFGKAIAQFQGVSFKIAKMAIETRVANHLVWEAATKVDADKDDALEGSLRALYRTHRSSLFVTDAAVQLLGGHGFVDEFPVEKWSRDAQAQAGLYGREQDLLTRRGERIVNGATGAKKGVLQ
ncbi:acyl-CoA dehydrogenase family protein [Salicibibacter cibarius]|uniref:Acyl-CoA dehydrogenase family protein n=1 Tax=Salicibibacter cibarius TaxID=2743000 RepID=A0A7T6Z0D7_9BACI|nr:acyl-CoA dehydrogenase family protein [Salicibibacter cibarius]QQK74589.1 acyl-CoA dehydrogenase family protein [Salicibibacter cibarius]